MTKSPIQQVIESTPRWFYRITDYNGLVLQPIREILLKDGSSSYQPCEPHEATGWTIGGHLKQGGVECIQNFLTETQARDFSDQLLQCYRHLRHYGLLA
jgi:hypothetical protein